ncbi:MAG: hypothetical protein QM730_05305 [Anaerolineales bacterium]
MWWYATEYKDRWALFTVIVACSCVFLALVTRLIGPDIGHFPMFSLAGVPDCHGTVTIDAVLVKVNYEMPFLLFIGICSELAMFILMFRQIKKATIARRESSISVVG